MLAKVKFPQPTAFDSHRSLAEKGKLVISIQRCDNTFAREVLAGSRYVIGRTPISMIYHEIRQLLRGKRGRIIYTLYRVDTFPASCAREIKRCLWLDEISDFREPVHTCTYIRVYRYIYVERKAKEGEIDVEQASRIITGCLATASICRPGFSFPVYRWEMWTPA